MSFSVIRYFVQRNVFIKKDLPWKCFIKYTETNHRNTKISKCSQYSHYCLNQQCRSFSCTLINYKKRKSKDEKEKEDKIESVSSHHAGGGGGGKPKNKTNVLGVIDVWRNITVAELANCLNRSVEHVQEVMLYVKGADNLEPTARLEDIKIIKEIVNKCGFKLKFIAAPSSIETEIKDKDVSPRPAAPKENLKLRSPVVTVMGHVDHGKTTLLDTLRGASVAAGEAGGITQHIGAFTVTLENGEKVTFLDTPGHAAFSAMRARGANCTDIIVLVVAADDGVMEQTKEVIKLATDANVPIIVAINKIDKPQADVERAKTQLLQMGLALEGHGGDVQVVGISAINGTNLQELADTISTQATLMNLKSEYTGLVEGIVVESKTDRYRGKLSTTIVTRGTLRKGCILVGGNAWAKVRGLFDHTGQPVDEAYPGTPVEIIGWRELPAAGDVILEVESERKANAVMRYRNALNLQEKATNSLDDIRLKEEKHADEYRTQREIRRKTGRFKLRQNFRTKESFPEDGIPKVNLILKGDVHGSVEAILDVLDTYSSSEKCRLNIIHYDVGEIIESDIELAKIFNAIIYAFNIKSSPNTAVQGGKNGVDVREFNIIYRIVDDLKEEINRHLPQIPVEEILGEANVLQIFNINEGRKEIPVIGCRCTKGILKKKSKFKLLRNGECIYDGELVSMRHLKNEVESIKNDVECGLRLADITVIAQPSDTIVSYITQMENQKIDWDPGF